MVSNKIICRDILQRWVRFLPQCFHVVYGISCIVNGNAQFFTWVWILFSDLLHIISRETQTLKRLVPWSVLLWSPWQPSCRLGCKHFRVVVHGLLQVPAPSLFLFFLRCLELSPNILSLIVSSPSLSFNLIPPSSIHLPFKTVAWIFQHISRLIYCFISAWQDSTS